MSPEQAKTFAVATWGKDAPHGQYAKHVWSEVRSVKAFKGLESFFSDSDFFQVEVSNPHSVVSGPGLRHFAIAWPRGGEPIALSELADLGAIVSQHVSPLTSHQDALTLLTSAGELFAWVPVTMADSIPEVQWPEAEWSPLSEDRKGGVFAVRAFRTDTAIGTFCRESLTVSGETITFERLRCDSRSGYR